MVFSLLILFDKGFNFHAEIGQLLNLHGNKPTSSSWFYYNSLNLKGIFRYCYAGLKN